MCTEKLLGVQREWRQLTLSYLHSSAADTPWLRDACSHREGSGDTPNMDREPGKSEWLAKGKPRNVPCKWFKLPLGCNSGALPVCLFSICTSYTLFPLNNYFSCFTTVFVEILPCKAEGPGSLSLTTGLGARFHGWNPVPSSDWEPKPCSKPLLAEATWDQHSLQSWGGIHILPMT